MVSFSDLSRFAASARNAVTPRQAMSTADNLKAINAAVQELVQIVTNYKGGFIAAAGISSQAATVSTDIKNATGDTKASQVKSDAEAVDLIKYITEILRASIQACMQALKDKKTELIAANLQGTVRGTLVGLRKDTATLGEALVEKAPLSQQEAAKAENAKVDALFEDAVKFFA